MRERLILLSHLVPSITAHSVWGLPLWAWRGYAAFHDQYVKDMREAGA